MKTKFMNKVYLIILSMMLVVVGVKAQHIDVHLGAGVTNYQGDLQAKRFTFNQGNFGMTAGIAYEVLPGLYARAELLYGKLQAQDKFQTRELNRLRNLSFYTNIFEFNVGAEYQFFDIDVDRVTPYVFAGVGIFRFNPYTYDENNNKVYLHPLHTEGQETSIHPDRKMYSLTQPVIPFGGGIKFAPAERIQLGIEMGIRKTFTDYLDDVSNKYADFFTLQNEYGTQAADLAFRTDELSGHISDPYPPDGAKRGEPKYKDWYYFVGATLTIRFGDGLNQSGILSSGSFRGKGWKRSTSCPKF